METKRTNALYSDIEEVEYQAFIATYTYYIETGFEYIWTMIYIDNAVQL